MSHRINSDLGKALALAGDARLVATTMSAPGTLVTEGKHFGLWTPAAGTWTLPDVSEDEVGVIVMVIPAGTVTLNTVALVAVATSAPAGTPFFIQSTSTTTWKAMNAATGQSLLDSGAYTTLTTVEDAIQQLYLNSNAIWVPVASFLDADGDPLAKFVDNASPNPGFNLANSEALGVRWNNNATQNQPVLSSIALPIGANSLTSLTMTIIASKTGATSGDATTFTVTAFANQAGSTHDASPDMGGVSGAMTGAAPAKTVQPVNVTITTPTAFGTLTFTITPTSGTLGTDDVIVHGVVFTYKM